MEKALKAKKPNPNEKVQNIRRQKALLFNIEQLVRSGHSEGDAMELVARRIAGTQGIDSIETARSTIKSLYGTRLNVPAITPTTPSVNGFPIRPQESLRPVQPALRPRKIPNQIRDPFAIDPFRP